MMTEPHENLCRPFVLHAIDSRYTTYLQDCTQSVGPLEEEEAVAVTDQDSGTLQQGLIGPR